MKNYSMHVEKDLNLSISFCKYLLKATNQIQTEGFLQVFHTASVHCTTINVEFSTQHYYISGNNLEGPGCKVIYDEHFPHTYITGHLCIPYSAKASKRFWHIGWLKWCTIGTSHQRIPQITNIWTDKNKCTFSTVAYIRDLCTIILY